MAAGEALRVVVGALEAQEIVIDHLQQNHLGLFSVPQQLPPPKKKKNWKISELFL